MLSGKFVEHYTGGLFFCAQHEISCSIPIPGASNFRLFITYTKFGVFSIYKVAEKLIQLSGAFDNLTLHIIIHTLFTYILFALTRVSPELHQGTALGH